MLPSPNLDQAVVLQFAVIGQHGLQFLPELHEVTDPARADIQCHINGQPLEPSEIMPHDFKPAFMDPTGIHSNKEGLSKVGNVSQVAFCRIWS